MDDDRRHILINGLSAGSGGGYTVASELLRHLGEARPTWRFTMALIEGHPLHEELRLEQLPPNCALTWAPARALRYAGRYRYENGALPRWAAREHVDAVIQLNGMLIRRLKLPTLCHNQDPWPYRPEAWDRLRDRVLAFVKRRAHSYAISHADACGWTSHYLEALISGALRQRPRRSCVFYNGVPEAWNARIAAGLTSWDDRPMELVTVSNVQPYKRQELVIRALPDLIREPPLQGLVYRVLGACSEAYKAHLNKLAERLGVAGHVAIEGRVARERVDEAYGRARGMVLMSVCESFGIPAVEAMSFGTPVVIADCCAPPEVCADAAERVPMDDRGALVAALRRVLTDSQRAEALRKAGVQRVQTFRWSATAEQMAGCLEQIAPRGRTARSRG